MPERVLITGGAGFIGSHVADVLLAHGYEVRVLDSLEPQVHGATDRPPAYLSRDAEFIRGDVRDRAVLDRALQGVSMVCHEAATVGVAQSMYEIQRYVHGNDCVTAALLQAIVDQRVKIKKLVVASSMSIYGEGRYKCPRCGLVAPHLRSEEQLQRQQWEVTCACGEIAAPVPTDEDKPPRLESVYAVGKKATEELSLTVGRAYQIPTVALRYFNTYGPRQALGNPYTGLLAIAAARAVNKKPMVIFEDGSQLRDFVYAGDVARANLAAMEWEGRGALAVNVGTGRPVSVLEAAERVRSGLAAKPAPEIKAQYRCGDIRHCYADTSRAQRLIGFKAETSFEDGLPFFLDWAAEEGSIKDLVDQGISELCAKGLIK